MQNFCQSLALVRVSSAPHQLCSDSYMVLNLLTFLQPCRALSSTLCDARRPYNASFFNGDLTILRDDRDRQVDLRIVIVVKKYEVEMIVLLPNETEG
jgi:hypothetical protein